MDEKLPPPIQVIQGDGKGGDSQDDDSLIKAGFEVKNPFQKFFDWIKNFIKRNQNITIKIPIIGIFIALFGTGYSIGFNNAVSKFFPDSSPLFHRAILVEGVIQKGSSNQFYLKSGTNVWTLKLTSQAFNLEDYLNEEVTVKGNLTKEKSVIEVSEIIPLETPSAKVVPTTPNIPNPPNSPNLQITDIELPELYSGLTWQTTQKRVLIFTSGKRKIEQEGVYLESSQLNVFPQDFINYYIQELKNASFRQTFNSVSPDGIIITYAKDDRFLTFGIKNIYQGSGDKKQLVGYKSYIEHN